MIRVSCALCRWSSQDEWIGTGDSRIGHRSSRERRSRTGFVIWIDLRASKTWMRDFNAVSNDMDWIWRQMTINGFGQTQLAEAQALMMAWASLEPGKRVLDIACGTGLVSSRGRAR